MYASMLDASIDETGLPSGDMIPFAYVEIIRVKWEMEGCCVALLCYVVHIHAKDV